MDIPKNERITLNLQFDFSTQNVSIFHVEEVVCEDKSRTHLVSLNFSELKNDPDPKLLEKILFGSCIHFLHPENHQLPSAGDWEKLIISLREKAKNGDVKQMRTLANSLAQYALISKDLTLLEEAQIAYEAAAKIDPGSARDFLIGAWKFIKEYYRDQIIARS